MAWIRACGGGSPAVPNGKTVTPINDVTIWQQCAGIANPTYTTLAEVMADNGVLSALMASDNAVDYLVRSKSFAKQEALVPTMTSNNTPSGIASATASNIDAWLMFDGDDSTYWDATGAFAEATVFYEFDTKKRIGSFAYMGYAINNTANSVSIVNSDGTELFTTNLGNVATLQNVSLSSVSVGTKFGLKFKSMYNSGGSNHSASGKTLQFYSELGVTENSNAMTYIGQNNYASNTLLADSDWREAICNSTYFESVLNVKVPTMTSNTTPSGTCTASATESGYYPYYAFDGNSSTKWYGSKGAYDKPFAQYDWGGKEFYLCYCVGTIGNPSSGGRITVSKLRGVDSNSNVIDFSSDIEITLSGNETNRQFEIVSNTYKKVVKGRFCSEVSSGATYSAYVETVQFYGREDV